MAKVVEAVTSSNPTYPDLTVYNAEYEFGVRVVRKGDPWGLNDCLTHNEDRPMIEFYLRSRLNEGKKYTGDTPRGHFVSRYYADTLAKTTGGLCLRGYERDLDLPLEAMEQVRTLIRSL